MIQLSLKLKLRHPQGAALAMRGSAPATSRGPQTRSNRRDFAARTNHNTPSGQDLVNRPTRGVLIKPTSPAESHRPAAWFLLGDSNARALEVLARCGLAEPGTRLYAVPRSTQDRALAGFLIVPGNTYDGPAPRGLPCRQIAGRLFIPVDAELFPPVSESELGSLCPYPAAFFHPTLGLSGFDADSALTVDALIELPEERSESWNSARSGTDPLPLLQGIILARPPTIDDVFGGAEKEIGTSPKGELPPMPGEPSKGLRGKTARAVRRLLAHGVLATTELFPNTAHERTWLNDLADWASRQLQQVGEQFDRIRNEELHRLLHLLANDPENGLRHAISLNQMPHRGVAPPGGRLGSRLPEFNAARLGGGPADFWNVSEDWQEILRRKYRDLADREMRLGRYRRAAYIYAELLGDLPSAASVLKQGRHYREAALLYEQHLKNPLEAARCLAEGGLLTEAIARYESLERWLDAAELYEKLGQPHAAHSLVRQVIDERRQADDPLGAAKLAQDRLHDDNAALDILLAAWPTSAQAALCLSRAFKLLGNLGRHQAARDHLARLRQAFVNDATSATLLAGLVPSANEYPDPLFRHQAADCSRILIAQQLSRPELAADRGAALVELLGRLAPHDRLLTRDGQRHLQARPAADLRRQNPGPQRSAPATGRRPEVVRRIELPRQMEWRQLRSAWHSYFAAGFTAKHLTIIRGAWDGPLQSLSWTCTTPIARTSLVMEPTGNRGEDLLIAVPGGARFSLKEFPATDAELPQSCTVHTPDWMHPGSVYSILEGARWSVHVAAGRAVLSCCDARNTLQQTLDLTQELLHGATRHDTARVLVQATGSGAAIALGNRLVLVRGRGQIDQFELTSQATGLIGTLPHTRQGLVILLEHGAAIYWAGARELLEVDRDIASPVGAFLPGGPLVLVSPEQKQLLLLDYDFRGMKQLSRTPLSHENPMAVTATASIAHFAVLDRGGALTVYKV